MPNITPHDEASATALLATVHLHTKHVEKYEFADVLRNLTRADERYALQCKSWCAPTMAVRWTARARTLQWWYQSLNQVVPIYVHIVYYMIHSTIHQHSPPHHHTVLLWGRKAEWNDYTVDMPPLHSLAGWGKCMPCCSNTWNAHNTCLQTLPYYCSCWIRSHSRETCIVRKGSTALFASYHVCRAAKGDTWWGSAIYNTEPEWLYSAYIIGCASTFKHATAFHACLLHILQWHEVIYSTTPTNHTFSSSHHGFRCDATHFHYIQQLNHIIQLYEY